MSEETQVPAMLQSIARTVEQIRVEAAFGRPIQVGENTLIPVAEVRYGFGFGAGRVPEEEKGPVGGEGGGAGGGVRPMGYIKVSPDGVVFEPAMDVNRLGMAGILLTAWCVFWIAKAVARKK